MANFYILEDKTNGIPCKPDHKFQIDYETMSKRDEDDFYIYAICSKCGTSAKWLV